MHVLSCFLEFLNLCWQTKGRASLSRKQAETLLTSLRQLQVKEGSRGNYSDQHEIKLHHYPLILTCRPFPGHFLPVWWGLIGHHEPLWAQHSPWSCWYARFLRGLPAAQLTPDLHLSFCLSRDAVRQEASWAAVWALCFWSPAHALPQLCLMCHPAAQTLW